mgnify:CR=1 FL=1
MSSYKILNPDGVELEHDAFVRDLLKILGSGAVPFIDLSDDISTLVIKSAEDQSFTIETELGEEVIKVDTNAKTFELVAPYSAVGFSGGGDMLKSVYDTGDNGVVDNSENLEGNNSAYHLDRSNHSGAEDLEDKVAMSGDITIAINGNLDDWNPTGLSTASVIRLNPSASYTITSDFLIASLAFTVSNPGSPGPAPVIYTIGLTSFNCMVKV